MAIFQVSFILVILVLVKGAVRLPVPLIEVVKTI